MNSDPKNSDVRFNQDFSQANCPDGSFIAFTRSESRAIGALAERAGRLLTRNQLLDAVSETGSEKNDRNIDFLINRIRRKLGDNPKEPRFIATRYGEGYVWVAKTGPVARDPGDVFLIVGPVQGANLLSDAPGFDQVVAEHFAKQLRGLLGPDQNVVVKADFGLDSGSAVAGHSLAVHLTFFRDGGKMECVVSAKSAHSNRILYVTRFDIAPFVRNGAALQAYAARIAPLLLAKAWQADTETGTDHVPLPVAMHEAGNKADNAQISWPQNDLRLRTLRAEHPDDPSIMLMYATHLHTKYVTRGRDLFYKGEDSCAVDEAEIEKLVLGSLDYAQSRPELAIIAAKLLYFVDRGYKSLALQLASDALPKCRSVASSLSIVGQLRGFVGDTDAAIESLTQAKHLSIKGSQHHIYVLVLLCQALMAAGRRRELAAVRSELYKASPLAAVFFEPLFSDPVSPSLRARGVALVLSRPRAVAVLKHLHYVSARLYEQPEHSENTLRTPINLFVRRFGSDVVPNEIKASISGLFEKT
jgi:DNA-binding winged helix-turn-helix (wHTH) protein